jgi:hypothetical protein
MGASKVVECIVEKFDISKYYGAFGEGTMDEFKEYEEEAQM